MVGTTVTVYDALISGGLRLMTRILNVIEYRYRRNYYTIGEFTMVIPQDENGGLIRLGDILYVEDDNSDDDTLYVTSKTFNDGRWTISGYDLKFLLTTRVTLFPQEEVEAGTYGYDVRQGWTSDIIKGYINYNLCEATDPDRRIEYSECQTIGNIGIEEDTYMSRLQPLNEVVEKLCANAGIGYRASLHTLSMRIVFEVFSGTDRTGKVVFGKGIEGVAGIKHTAENANEKTIAWTVNGTSINNTVVTAVSTGDELNSGIYRRETVYTMNCPQDDVAMYAKKSAESAVRTNEIDIEISVPDYRVYCNVGDIVRVLGHGIVMDDMSARVIAAEKHYVGNQRRTRLILAPYESPKLPVKPINKLVARASEAQSSMVDQKLAEVGSGGGGESGITINQAVVIHPDDAPYILHEFTEIAYDKGNRVGYAGSKNQIIVQGYIVYKENGTAPNGTEVKNVEDDSESVIPNVPTYTDLSVRGTCNNAPFTRVYAKLKESKTDRDEYQVLFDTGEYLSYANQSGYQYGIALVWTRIYPPDADYENGYAFCNVYVKCRNPVTSNGKYRFYKDNWKSGLALPFASLDEYNAAVGLTYERVDTLYNVQDNITEV